MKSQAIIISEQNRQIASLAKALKLGCAALHDQPLVDQKYTAQHKTRDAFALVTMQAGVALAEGAPFDPSGTDLVRLLEAARDAIEFLLTRAEYRAGDDRAFQSAERAMVDLMRLVGPGPLERRVQEFVDAYAGERPCDSEPI